MRLFDAHCDTLTTAFASGEELLNNNGHISIENAEYLNQYSQLFAIWTDDYIEEPPFERFLRIYDYLQEQIEKNKSKIILCKSRKDYEDACKTGKIAAMLSIEGGRVIEGDINRIEYLYSLGVRVMSLTWNGKNELAGGAQAAGSGLSLNGRRAVIKMKELNMALDVSHLNDKCFFEAASYGGLMVATHSNSRVLCNHPRNLTDEQFNIIKESGGGAGINLYPVFLCKDAKICDIIRHIEHFLSLGGAKHLFFGADFDGVDQLPKDIRGIVSMKNLYKEMLKIYDKELVDDIFYNNLERIMLKLYPVI